MLRLFAPAASVRVGRLIYFTSSSSFFFTLNSMPMRLTAIAARARVSKQGRIHTRAPSHAAQRTGEQRGGAEVDQLHGLRDGYLLGVLEHVDNCKAKAKEAGLVSDEAASTQAGGTHP